MRRPSAGASTSSVRPRAIAVFGDAGLENRVLPLAERRRRGYTELGLDSMTVGELEDYTVS